MLRSFSLIRLHPPLAHATPNAHAVQSKQLLTYLRKHIHHHPNHELLYTCLFMSCSCLLFPLLPALSAASPVTALLPVTPLASLLLVVACGSVAAAHCKGRGREAVREVDLRADSVGEVRHNEDVLDMVVAAAVSGEYIITK
jgi:hypothetical protein